MSPLLRKFASRKFIAAMAVLVIFTVLRVKDMCSSAELVQITTWVLGLYFGANVSQKALVPPEGPKP